MEQPGLFPLLYIIILTPFNDETDSKIPTFTSVKLFEREMKYLHDNGFKVIAMVDLGYDENKNQLCIKNKS
jgi:hypothetical protein